MAVHHVLPTRTVLHPCDVLAFITPPIALGDTRPRSCSGATHG